MSPGRGGRPIGVRGRIVLVARGGEEVASWSLPAVRPDLDVVAELARLQLAARRLGCSIALREACGGLRGLVELAGLADVLPAAAGASVEVGGEAELGEQLLGVEEGVEPGDAAV